MSEQLLNEKDVIHAIWDAILKLFGEYGASQVNLALIEYAPQKSYAVVRCLHKALEMVKTSIASITEINGKPVVVHIVGVSGTLKALRKKAAM
ncbi:MAG: Rpp14/Pop5 family protein [Candidatus Bathyarchaeota archaeon]|nr:MAG: Rpp14/Pop5 family protein [Candidatus Bathyarchaeota archaeon]